MESFVHLQVKSEYSLLTSTCRMNELISQASFHHYDALALTDRNAMFGAHKFHQACLKAGIKPIFGLELDIISNSVQGTVLLYAINEHGYTALMRMSTLVMSRKSPLPTDEIWGLLSDSVIVILPEMSHPIAKLLAEGDKKEAEREVRNWQEKIAANNLYAGLLPPANTAVNDHAHWQTFFDNLDVPLAATGNVTMLNEDDDWIKKCLHSIRTERSIEEINHYEWRNETYLFKKEEAEKLWPEDAAALNHTKQIAEKCNVDPSNFQSSLPEYRDSVEEKRERLRTLAKQGAMKRYDVLSDIEKSRLSKELHVIESMGFEDYFLIVWDFMRFARKEGMLTGPGRGSAAGSMVAYCLFITDINPLNYDLLFERFLNPERISLPDIDIDFPDHRRDEVIHYIAEKYGFDHAAQIITFGTFGMKAALRDTAKALGTAEALLQRLLSFLPSSAKGLADALQHSSELQAMIDENEQARTLFSHAKAIEGLPRHTSLHAAGVVLSSRPLEQVIPIIKNENAVSLTQFPMEDLGAFGLLKIDLLGLRNLTLLEHLRDDVYHYTGQMINPKHLGVEDQTTYELLSAAQTTGVFQFESSGMQQVLKKLKPNRFEDLIAVNALYRPGPMDNIDAFIQGKHNPTQIAYPHVSLKPILASTYGVMVYQEQIMQVAVTIAGYSLARADLLRRSVSKKNREELEKERMSFIEGAVANGYDEQIAVKLFQWILKFANYGFNRSHAAAYSYIAYQIAYFKAHYPLIFYAAYLNMIGNDKAKVQRTIAEMKQKGWYMLPPTINESRSRFIVSENGVRFPLHSIAQVGRNVVEKLDEEREQRGRFTSFVDFCRRLKETNVNRRLLTNLIKAGAMDEFGQNRATLLASIERALEFVDFEEDVGALFRSGEDDFRYAEADPYSQIEMLELEKEMTGFYLNGHPLNEYDKVFAIRKPITIMQLQELKENERVWVTGVADPIKSIRTKNGQSMAFIQLTDDTSEIEIVIFPKVYRLALGAMVEGEHLLIFGKLEENQYGRKLIADQVLTLEQADEALTHSLYMKIPGEMNRNKTLHAIKRQLVHFPGFSAVKVYDETKKQLYELTKDYRVHLNSELFERLQRIVGEENVVKKIE